MPNYTRYMSLQNKVIYITGGATGIGATLVEAFTVQGAQVIFNDVQEEAATELIEYLQHERHQPEFITIDVTNEKALQQSIRKVHKKCGHIDVLINNVANDTRHSPLDITPEEWKYYLAVNLGANFFSCQAAIPIMQKQQSGVIINISSINALLGPEDMPAYVSAKSGQLGLTKALANQYGVDNIRVNSILPGWVATERQLDLWLTPEIEAEWSTLTALKNRIYPSEVARLALFLAADDAKMITGQQFVIDAGRV